jgi:hypothetical protein
METDPKLFKYDSFIAQSTGRISEGEDYKILTTTFDRYDIKIKVSLENEFIEVLEVKINKDFLSQKQRMGTQSYLDVEKYYRE